MNVAIVVPTHNRLEYSRKCIERLLKYQTDEFDLYLWDNASTDETPEYLKNLKDNRIKEVVLSKENVGQAGAMNYVWSKTKAELVGKLDNDCLVTPGWVRILGRAHQDVSEFGSIACWHYPLDEFDETAAKKAGKIQTFDGHQIVRHPWVCGSGFLMKRSTFQKYGYWKKGTDVGTSYYFTRMALDGVVNGWYYPLIWQEHMDDPRSEYCLVTDDKSLKEMYDTTYTLRVKKITSMKNRWARRPLILANLNSGPWEAKYYVGCRRKLRSIIDKLKKMA